MTNNSHQEKDLVLMRLIDAPREKVWKAWMEQRHLVKWWGQPKGAVMPFAKLDFRVGGSFHYQVKLPDGTVVWGKKIYKEIAEPERLMFDDYYTDEKGTIVTNGKLPKMTITATLEDLGDKTELIVRHANIGGDKVHTMDQYRQGWSQSLDRLDDAVEKM